MSNRSVGMEEGMAITRSVPPETLNLILSGASFLLDNVSWSTINGTEVAEVSVERTLEVYRPLRSAPV